jgi:hypothetical protein
VSTVIDDHVAARADGSDACCRFQLQIGHALAAIVGGCTSAAYVLGGFVLVIAAAKAMETISTVFAAAREPSAVGLHPPERYLDDYRAGYQDETPALVEYLVDILEIPADQIAVFAQNDSYGDDGFRGVARALRAYGVRAEDILRVGHERNSVRVSEAVQQLADQKQQVRAVIMVATNKPAARRVRSLKGLDLDMRFAALSFVGSEALSEVFRQIGTEYADGVIVTQVVPFH